MNFSVKNKIALVTGANRGIGKVIVETLLKNGASKVYAAVRNPDSASDLVKASGDRVVAIELDLAKPATIAAAAKTAKDVQLVVNNAGVLKTASPIDPGAIDALQFEINVNVYGLIRMAQAFAPVLAANGGGAFVQLNSVVSIKNFADFATYSASKAASYSITQGLRDKLKLQGTAVVSVHPGPIATDMADAAGLGAIAEPASLVADGIVAALAAGEFHVFPDSMARKFWSAYQSFAKNVVEADITEG
jgi:NAD(P)-dependent dehydrogenase (short-subunit alcohol dehydrogenase family)